MIRRWLRMVILELMYDQKLADLCPEAPAPRISRIADVRQISEAAATEASIEEENVNLFRIGRENDEEICSG